ncbi:MAG: phage holin family protein [Comamonadaceae bacterium]|nr:phage holin family protein [Comamonadaceae bacterium]RRD57728.1 hypothetical protein EII20_05640 [Comamonadaceae bacterium OH2545_COT-014]
MSDFLTRRGVAGRLRGLLADTLELAQVRLELLIIEAREEAARLLSMIVFGLVSVIFISFGLVFLAVFLTVWMWDTHRLLLLGIFTALFLGGGLTLLGLAVARAREDTRLFATSRQELQRDQEELRP